MSGWRGTLIDPDNTHYVWTRDGSGFQVMVLCPEIPRERLEREFEQWRQQQEADREAQAEHERQQQAERERIEREQQREERRRQRREEREAEAERGRLEAEEARARAAEHDRQQQQRAADEQRERQEWEANLLRLTVPQLKEVATQLDLRRAGTTWKVACPPDGNRDAIRTAIRSRYTATFDEADADIGRALRLSMVLPAVEPRQPRAAAAPSRRGRAADDIRSLADFVASRAEAAETLAGTTGFTREAGTCTVCFSDEQPLIVMSGCSMHHADAPGLCAECMSNYLQEQMQEVIRFPVKCPCKPCTCGRTPCTCNPCTVIVRPDVAREVLTEQERYHRFLEFHLRKVLLPGKEATIVHCPTCKTRLMMDEATVHGQPVVCSQCLSQKCIDCGCNWHADLTCAEYQERNGQAARDDEGTRATEELLRRTSKRCPNCGEGICHYRGHACHHIKPGSGCPRCSHHFCYVCLGPHRTCGCPWQGSSFCMPRPGVEQNERGDCGCPDCPDCRPGQPCRDCDGCFVCQPETRPRGVFR